MAVYNYLTYKPYIYNTENKKYRTVIRKSDGTYIKVKPIIYTRINAAIANNAIVGISRVG